MPWRKNAKLPLPADDTTIWRYMDLPKFLSLLEQKALYFAVRAELEDKWEALIHRPDFKNMVACLGGEPAKNLKGALERVNTLAAMSCWYRGREESVAMWALYTHTTFGVAIRSDIGRLKRALAAYLGDIQIGVVEYRDLDDDSAAPLDSGGQRFLFQKRRCYEHERELRAWTLARPGTSAGTKRPSGFQAPEHGLLVPVDLAEVIECVRLGPHFPRWAQALIESALQRAGISPPISESAAFAPPPADDPAEAAPIP